MMEILGQVFTNFINALYNFTGLEFGNVDVGSVAVEADEYFQTAAAFSNIKTVSFYAVLILALLGLFFGLGIKRMIKAKRKVKEAKQAGHFAAVSTSALQARWDEIKRHTESIKELEWRFAVIEADKLMDDVLGRSGFLGESMGEKLMSIQPGQLNHIQGLWEAHKTRNRIVHEPNYFLRHLEAKRAIENYENALRELRAIE